MGRLLDGYLEAPEPLQIDVGEQPITRFGLLEEPHIGFRWRSSVQQPVGDERQPREGLAVALEPQLGIVPRVPCADQELVIWWSQMKW